MLVAWLARLVAASVEDYVLVLRVLGWLRNDFGNGLRCALGFGAGLARAEAPDVPIWVCICE